MSEKRFGNVKECSDFVLLVTSDTDEETLPRWTLSPEVIAKNREIDENIRHLDINVARSAAALV